MSWWLSSHKVLNILDWKRYEEWLCQVLGHSWELFIDYSNLLFALSVYSIIIRFSVFSGEPISRGAIGYNFEKERLMKEKQKVKMRIEVIRMSVRDTLANEYGYNKNLIEFENGKREGYTVILINGFNVAHFLTEEKMEESDYKILDEVITTEYLYVGDTYLRDGKSREELIKEFKDNNNDPEINTQIKKEVKTKY